jgi:hypothetical protein
LSGKDFSLAVGHIPRVNIQRDGSHSRIGARGGTHAFTSSSIFGRSRRQKPEAANSIGSSMPYHSNHYAKNYCE